MLSAFSLSPLSSERLPLFKYPATDGLAILSVLFLNDGTIRPLGPSIILEPLICFYLEGVPQTLFSRRRVLISLFALKLNPCECATRTMLFGSLISITMLLPYLISVPISVSKQFKISTITFEGNPVISAKVVMSRSLQMQVSNSRFDN